MAILSITKEFHFDAAHRLWSANLSEQENLQLYGKCSRLHGHAYRLQVTVSGPLRDNGMIIHFSEFKTFVRQKLLNRYDHSYLNELEEYLDLPVTAENMVRYIFQVLENTLHSIGIVLESVALYETPSSWATMSREGFHA